MDPSIRGGRPLGWELAERYPHVYRDGPLPLRPKGCPICGHPTGNCTQEDHAIMAKATRQVETQTPDDVRAALQGGRLTAEEANQRAVQNAPPGPTYVVVKEDVYAEVEDPGATTKREVLRYHKGQVITEDQAKADKVKAVQQQDVRGGQTK